MGHTYETLIDGCCDGDFIKSGGRFKANALAVGHWPFCSLMGMRFFCLNIQLAWTWTAFKSALWDNATRATLPLTLNLTLAFALTLWSRLLCWLCADKRIVLSTGMIYAPAHSNWANRRSRQPTSCPWAGATGMCDGNGGFRGCSNRADVFFSHISVRFLWRSAESRQAAIPTCPPALFFPYIHIWNGFFASGFVELKNWCENSKGVASVCVGCCKITSCVKLCELRTEKKKIKI